MLKLFDLDGTLITSYMDNPDRAYDRWHVLPGRVARLAAERAAGHQVGIVTNQGGVAFGHVREQHATAKIAAVLQALQLPADTPVAVCYADPRSKNPRYTAPAQVARRKPSGAMIRELVAAYPEAAADGVLFVGDRPEDAAAAMHAGVAFVWADAYFAADAP
ncbi:MAG TPA: HAD-IIIA family hydrolase [Chloroflexia bacterium]|nr:HAD-IIIA family hydrolase [Chloroflexia bacterium]